MRPIVFVLFALFGSALSNNYCEALVDYCNLAGSCPDAASNSITLDDTSYSFGSFDVISFGNLKMRTGDVQRRTAIKGDFSSVEEGTSFGDRLTDEEGLANAYSFVIGGNVNWREGSVYPANSGIFVGGSYAGPASLAGRILGNCSSSGCLNQYFDNAKAYYASLSNYMASHESNVEYSVLYGTVTLTCSADAAIYYVSISSSDFSKIISYSTAGCQSSAHWVFNIMGDSDVVFDGVPFVHGTIYNVMGSGTVRVRTFVYGSILVPNGKFDQPAGTVFGAVIAGDMEYLLQVNPPECPNGGSTGQVSTGGASTSGEHVSTSGDYASTSGDHVSTSGDYASTSGDHVSTSGDHVSTSGDHVSTSGNQGSTSGNQGTTGAPNPNPDSEKIYAITIDYKLVFVESSSPSGLTVVGAISGLKEGHVLRSIDFRPNGGDLIAVSSRPDAAAGTSEGQLYTVDLQTAALSPIGNGFIFDSVDTEVLIDFNPTVDRIRFVTGDGVNLRLNPTAGTGGIVGNDTDIEWDAQDENANLDGPRLLNIAYSNNVNGTTITTLYGLEANSNSFVSVGSVGSAPVSPNSGITFTIAALNQTLSAPVGFDISGPSGRPYVTVGRTLWTINLSSGALTSIGTLPVDILDFSVAAAGSLPDEGTTGGQGGDDVEQIFAITTDYQLVYFEPANPSGLTTVGAISGLREGHVLRSIDFRPNGGDLIAVSSRPDAAAGTSEGQLYTVDLQTAALSPIGNGFVFDSVDTEVLIDFNPTVDRIRFVTGDGVNLRLNPTAGTGGIVGNDTDIAWDAQDENANLDGPRLLNIAYSDNFNGTTITTLYGLEANSNSFVSIGSVGSAPVSPNSGITFTIAALNQTLSAPVGFDISGPTGRPYVTVGRTLWTINLSSGALTAIGTLPVDILDFSVTADDTDFGGDESSTGGNNGNGEPWLTGANNNENSGASLAPVFVGAILAVFSLVM